MDLSKLSLIELKALAYDQMVALQQIQSNLQLINTAIANKIQLESNVQLPTVEEHKMGL